MAHNWFAECAKCHRHQMKRNMVSVKVGAYSPKQLCWLCSGCFAALLDYLEVSM